MTIDIKLSSWHSYGKIWALGHRNIKDIFDGTVVIEEKIDGSQFSYMSHHSELKLKSHHKELHYPVDQKQFIPVAERAHELYQKGLLTEGYTYRCEAITKPKHNCLAYDRCPDGYMVLFDVETEAHVFMSPQEKYDEAIRLGLEPVRGIYEGHGGTISRDWLTAQLETISQLGGSKIEGVVVKNYDRFGQDGHCLMGKYVSEKFKEVQKSDWKKSNPGQKDIIQQLIEIYRSEARWHKAIQHLKEKGELEGDPRDIGKLIREVATDIHTECQDEIKEKLFKWAWKQIQSGFTRGLPEFYKQLLLEKQFGDTDG